jgi:tetratricopeptide (TPR) repeat protein
MTTILNKEKILEQARIFADEGKYDKAIAEYEKILIADPSDLRVKLRVAELYTKRKQVNEAIRIFREVAESYAAEGFYLKAVTVLKNILRLNPTLIDVNLMLAELYEKMGLINDAIRQYDILATTLDHKGESGRSIDIRKKIVDLSPTSETARVRYAEMLQREGRGEEAVDQYEQIAKAYEREGKKDLRLADIYEKILAHRDNIEMLRALCRIYDSLGEKKKVLKSIEGAKASAGFDPELLEMQARIYASLNQMETAKSKYLALADVQKDEGNIEGAVKAYAEIIILLPGEKDRIIRRASELGEEAVEGLKKIVEARLEEETEKVRKEEERLKEEEEKKQKEEEARKAQAARLKEEQRKAAKAKLQEEKLKKEAAKGPLTAPSRPESPPPAPRSPRPAPAQDQLRKAEAALNLGKLYMNMDLKEEAAKELEKARVLFEEVSKHGGAEEPMAKARLRDIKNLLSTKKKEAKPPQPPPAEEKKKEEKKEAAPAEEKPKKEEKKKISFV